MTRGRTLRVALLALGIGASLLASAQAAEQGRRGMGMRGSLLGLLRMEQVQKDLKLTEEQMAKVKEVGEKIRAEMADQFAEVQKIENRQEQRARLNELSDQLDQKAREPLREVLSREQMMRLFQIRLQVRGPLYALNNRFLAERLKLTEEQKQKAAELQKATDEKVAAAFASFRDMSEEQRSQAREKLSQIRREADEQALAILTAEQKEALEKMKGEKIEL